MTPAQLHVPTPLQVWRAVANWLGFFLHVLSQIFRGTLPLPLPLFRLLSYLGLGYPLLSSSASSSFRPLPVDELPLHDSWPEHPSVLLPSPAFPPVRVVELTSFSDGISDDDSDGDDRPLDKLTVVLDLDETLVCAYETSSLPAILQTQAIEAGLKWFECECESSDKDCEGKPIISYITVYERPGLQEFLKQISEFSELVLFTAGLEGYAKPIVDKIDPENRISKRLYRPSTVSTKYRENVKDLSILSKDLSRVVIVDNNPFSFLLQPLNGIPCVPFSPKQPNDDQLFGVLLPLLEHLSVQKDVRPVLYEKFHMPEWFQMHGIPASDMEIKNDEVVPIRNSDEYFCNFSSDMDGEEHHSTA